MIAVSILSPVKTQTLIPYFKILNYSIYNIKYKPACLSAYIVSSTSGYNLSSIAVAPTNFKLCSISCYLIRNVLPK